MAGEIAFRMENGLQNPGQSSYSSKAEMIQTFRTCISSINEMSNIDL